jgi:O-antigen ligase
MAHDPPASALPRSERLYFALIVTVLTVLPPIGLAAGPAYAPLLFGLAVIASLARGTWPRPDWPLTGLALAFLAVCAVGLAQSINQAVSTARLGQLTGIFTGSLLLLSLPRGDGFLATRLATRMFWAVLLATVMLCADTVLGYPLQRLLTGGAANAATKYNRGVIALTLIVWPLLGALVARGNAKKAIILAAAMLVAVLVGLSSTGSVALAVGAVVWRLARWRLRLTSLMAGALLLPFALALPWYLRVLSAARPQLAPLIKPSGLHRLEIWDYMSARILERPFSGWGLGVAKYVPISADELASYVYVSPDGIYPHNQWIELWLETGLPGLLIALALVGVALWRATESYKVAAIAAALTASTLNFEITTDSWWAALAVTALLFKLLRTWPDSGEDRSTRTASGPEPANSPPPPPN